MRIGPPDRADQRGDAEAEPDGDEHLLDVPPVERADQEELDERGDDRPDDEPDHGSEENRGRPGRPSSFVCEYHMA